ncbi:MAG: DegT/DnrJ/EryC1/StrS family aminotransferase [bacterium]
MTAILPLYDVARLARSRADDYCADFRRVLASGRFVFGPELAGFETELARLVGTDRAFGVKSGTDAIILGLEALGIGPGDEVITTPFTYFATVEAIVRAGATPVLADIDPATLCLDPDACAAAVTPRTRAVLLVHLFGHCADLDRFAELCRARSLLLVEDAAQALGATWRGRPLGSFGAAATFSFYPTKNLAALGDAGAVVTSDPVAASRLEQLRRHGRDDEGRHVRWGWNSRLDEIQAALLRRSLPALAADTARRRELARRYDEALTGLATVVRPADGCDSCRHQYAILTPARDRLRTFLADNGVETGCYYPTPVHHEPVLAGLGLSFSNAERAGREVLNLPVRASLSDAEQDRVIGLLREFLR